MTKKELIEVATQFKMESEFAKKEMKRIREMLDIIDKKIPSSTFKELQNELDEINKKFCVETIKTLKNIEEEFKGE